MEVVVLIGAARDMAAGRVLFAGVYAIIGVVLLILTTKI